MASVQAELLARLLADSAVSAVIGTKGYLSAVPAGTPPPYIVLSMVSGPTYGHDLERGAFRWASGRVQVDVWCAGDGDRSTLGEAIRQSVQGMTGEIVSGGLWCFGAGFEGPAEIQLAPRRGEEKPVFGGRCDIQIAWQAPAVT